MSEPIPAGTKIAAQMSAEPTESDFRFVRQMGIEYAVAWTDPEHAGYDYYASRRELFESHGLTIYGFGNSGVHNQDAIVLNLADRDAKIAEYQRHLRALGKAGIPYTTYAHMANGIWTSGREETRGGASARALDMDNNPWGRWQDRRYTLPLSHGREYSEREIWDNFAHFIREVAPVAEDAGVLIGIHPDDPPLPTLAGVPALHLFQLRRLPARHGDRRQPQRRHLLLRGLLAGGRRSDGQGGDRVDPSLRARRARSTRSTSAT